MPDQKVPLNTHAFAAANSLLEQRAEKGDSLFHHRSGDRMKTARDSFEEMVKRAKLKDVIPYTLRHTFGAWSVKAGVNPRILQKLMGHSPIDVARQP
jgi:integrase